MPEFDPKSENHFPLLIIKAVELECTTEIQIEHVRTGVLERFTTTDSEEADNALFERKVKKAWREAWKRYQK